MLGIGRLVKEVSYEVRIRYRQDPWHRLLATVAPNFHEYRRLFHLSNDIVISPELKYLYVANLKAASTSVRNRLWELAGNAPLDDPTDVWESQGGLKFARNLDENTILTAFHSPDWFRFSIARNPFSRLISAYNFLTPRLEGPEYNARKTRLIPSKYRWHPNFDNTMSFEQFIDIACSHNEFYCDPHLCRQVDLLHIHAVSYDFIGKAENLAEDLTYLLKRFEAPDWVVDRASKVENKSTGRRKADSWFSGKLADKVLTHYEEDFRAFGYPLELPD